MTAPAFGLVLDPMRPHDVVPPPGLAERPPYCPICAPDDVFLYAVTQNGAGDVLFECLNDGYEAVWRNAGNAWEPRPGRDPSDWPPPLLSAPSARPVRSPVLQVPEDEDEPEPDRDEDDDEDEDAD